MENKGKREKGAQYERVIAEIFGEWWCHDKNAFWRTAGSGSRAHHPDVDIHPLDIAPIKTLEQPFPLGIECRHRQVWTLDKILKVKKPEILQWFVKAYDDIERDSGGKYLTVLIATKNYYPNLIIYPNWMVGSWWTPSAPLSLSIFLEQNAYPSLIITELGSFLEAYGPLDFANVYHGTEIFNEMKYAETQIVKKVREYIE